MADPLNIMIVDDSAIIRKILEKIISPHQDLKIIEVAKDGLEALEKLAKPELQKKLNVIILDIEMPRLDGLSALPDIKKYVPDAKVIIASTLSQKGAEITLKALEAGATDYLPKPSANETNEAFDTFSHELLEKIRIHGRISQLRMRRLKALPTHTPAEPSPFKEERPEPAPIITSSKPSLVKPEAIAIGCSTGGPEALRVLFTGLDKARIAKYPIFITQHMPPHFTTMLAQNISKNTGHDCVEAEDGMEVVAGRVYLARGDYHMEIEGNALGKKVRVNKNPQENFCRPAVDPMLRSLVKVYHNKLLTVIMTGMGQDGLKGCQDVHAAGGTVIAQDEESSVVWGMPGVVAKAGICSAVLPLSDLARKVMEICK